MVIGNPPYIQLQNNEGELGNRYQNTGFATFVRRGDIYQLFYEKGCRLLKPRHGLLAYITSNSWLKAKYGGATRRYFAERQTPLRLLEMGKDIFENTIVDTNVLLLREGSGDKANPVVAAVDMDQLDTKDFPPDAGLWGQTRPDGEKPWSILSLGERRIMDKMQAIGTPLRDWNVRINYGIKTGYNEAFIINTEARARLIREDPRSAEILKPILRGKDIARYQANWADKWVILAAYGSHTYIQQRYPAIYGHLHKYKDELAKRGQCRYGGKGNAGQHHWLELDNNPSENYLENFAKEKLVWIDLTDRGRFVYDDDGMFCVNTAFIMSGDSMKFLCAMLNSSPITFFMQRTALNSGMGVPRWILHTVQTIPIPKIPPAEQEPFAFLVDRVVAAKRTNPKADTTDLEAEIDQLVYKLYGLTAEEIKAVQGAS